MKGWKSRLKKGMVFALSLVMTAGLAPAMSGGADTVQATGLPEGAYNPDVSMYATKEQMMDDTFRPGDDGTAANIGKLVLGKNSIGKAQEWYILGKDNGVDGDNVIVFTASPIKQNQWFVLDTSDKTYTEGYGVYENAPQNVCANHYGASELRALLKAMTDGSNTSYFTTAEQNLMNATTVTTKDYLNSNIYNSNIYYSTTDKLYIPDGTVSSKTIQAGSSNNTKLAKDSYWSDTDTGE